MSQVSPWWQLKSGMITVLELCPPSFPAWLCGSGGRNLGPGCHTKAHRATHDKGLWLILPRMRQSLCSLTWFLPGLRNIQLTPGRRVDCFLLPQNSEGVIDVLLTDDSLLPFPTLLSSLDVFSAFFCQLLAQDTVPLPSPALLLTRGFLWPVTGLARIRGWEESKISVDLPNPVLLQCL